MLALLKNLLHPLRWAQDRIDRWVMARIKRQPGPVMISRRRLYILPTRYGYSFAVLSLVMLLGSMNYSNSMGFALTFLLIALGMVCMHVTHGNLVDVQIRPGKSPPVFAGEIAHFEVQIDNFATRPRYSLALSWPKYTDPGAEIDDTGRPTHGRRRSRLDDAEVTGDVPAQAANTLKLALPAARRGWMPARVFSLASEFPLGLFHAWTWAELDMACLVYPRPAAPGREPPPAAGASGLHSSGKSGQDEFAGLRPYQRGDSLRSVHWKSLPKLRNPMVKQFTELLDQELWLDWDALPDLEPEARLSQLTRWVLDAEAEARNYGLKLPGRKLRPARGEHHQHECLKALALFKT